MIPAASVTGRTATAHRSIPASVPSGTFRQSLLVLTLLGACLPQVRATLPIQAVLDNNALYKQGYLDVTLYTGSNGTTNKVTVTTTVNPTGAQVLATTAGLNEAIKDAYENKLVVYIPAGTYVVNNTIKAYTAAGIGGPAWNTPANHIAIVGQKGSRPVIKLALGAVGFNDAAKPKAVVEFMNFARVKLEGEDVTERVSKLPEDDDDDFRYFWEDPSTGFGQMIRDVDIDCRMSGYTGPDHNAGAIGLYFNQAQTSSIENVRIQAKGALSGITGLPGRSWGVVNIEVVEGQYGIDTNPVPRNEPNPDQLAALIAPYRKGDNTVLTPTKNNQNLFSPANAGSVIVGAKLTNQTVSAVRLGSFVPVVMVGFEITTSINQPVMTMQPRFLTGDGAVSLIDGKITRTGPSSSALINNSSRNNLYLRNVHMTGSDNLVDNGSDAPLNGSSTWKHIAEYSYTANPTGAAFHQDALNLIEGSNSITQPLPFITSNAIAPPADLRTKHFWTELPAMTDLDVVDATSPTLAVHIPKGGVINHAMLQAIINDHPKVFLPAGVYQLDGPIILRANTVLFGAGRQVTRIEVAPSFLVKVNTTSGQPMETPIITTDDSTTATTYLGDLTIGVDVGTQTDLSRDWFVALHWKAGGKSMVHMGQPYRMNTDTNREKTNAHSLMKISNSGGGRWYFAGAIKTRTGGHSNYRILKVYNTREPLSIYGLNVEHPGGEEDFTGPGGTFNGTVAETSPTTFTEFSNAENIRIYGVKSEFSAKDGQRDEPLLGDKLVDATGPISPAGNSRVASFVSCKNIAVFGPGAIRNGVNGKGVFEFNSTCARVLATQITPQLDRFSTPDDDTLREPGRPDNLTVFNGITYPNVVALFKRGVITQDIDESAMNHN